MSPGRPWERLHQDANGPKMRIMKKLVLAVRTCPVAPTLFGVGSLILLTLKIFWFDTIPAAFVQAHAAGNIAESLLAGNVAAYVFFVISYQLPLVIEKSRVASMIARLCDLAANGVTGFLQMIHGSTNGGLLNQDEIKKSDVEQLFGSVAPCALAPMATSALAPPLTWLGAMALHDEQCREYIAQIWRFVRFLEPDLVALLYEIEDSAHTSGMKDVRQYMLRVGVNVTNADLGSWADNYWACYELAQRLARYSAKYRAMYVA